MRGCPPVGLLSLVINNFMFCYKYYFVWISILAFLNCLFNVVSSVGLFSNHLPWSVFRCTMYIVTQSTIGFYHSVRGVATQKHVTHDRSECFFHMGIRWHVYVMEQVIKSASLIKQVNNLQSIFWCNTKPSQLNILFSCTCLASYTEKDELHKRLKAQS